MAINGDVCFKFGAVLQEIYRELWLDSWTKPIKMKKDKPFL